ncbi:uncharacterized protein [Dysidea avara]|uniref:uncharacterized protein n=1 Tax=Dysidea avara TaxID=196820 RepID=UPI003320B968
MIKSYEKSHPELKISEDGLRAFEKIAYSLALQQGKAKALGIKLLLFGPEFVGKTCLVSTLVGDPYQEERATEGADMSILNTSNWTKITADQVSDRLQEKFLRDLKESAKSHTEVATGEKMPEKAIHYPDELSPGIPTARPTFLKKAMNFISPRKKDLPTKYSAPTPKLKLDTSEIKQAMKAPSIDLGDEDGIDVTILDFAGQIMYHSTHSVFIRKDNIIMVVFNASQPLSSNVKVRSSTLRSDPMTNSQNVHFWMKTVHSICHVPGGENDKADLLPVILLVATHLDLLGDSAEQAKEDVIQQLAQELKGKPYAHHLAGHREGLVQALRKYCIFISNKCRNPAEISRLQNAVFELSQPILLKEHPVVYLKIERRLLSIEKGVLTTKEFHAVTEECGFPVTIDSKEFVGALEYFHNRGTVLHFQSIKSLQKLVFLSPHWLTKLLSYLLLAHPYQRITGRYGNSFLLLIENGILLGSFLSYMLDLFNKSECVTGSEADSQEAVALMKRFGFVAEISTTTYFLEENDKFHQEEGLLIVPTLLPEDPQNDKQIPSEDDPNVKVVRYYFPDRFISPTIYNTMVAECINWNTENHEDLIWLRKGKAKMVLGNGQDYCVSLAEEEHCIKLSIILSADTEHSAKERRDLLEFFQSKLEEIVTDFMPASKMPIAYIPCFYCDQLHARVEVLLEGKQLRCPVKDKPLPKDYYCSLVTDQDENMPVVSSSTETSTLTATAESEKVPAKSSVVASSLKGTAKKEMSYPELLKWVKQTANWQLLATFLLNEHTVSRDIDIIKDEAREKVIKCQIALARKFTESTDVEVSWRRVYDAFINADCSNIAEEIRKKYLLK